MTHDLPPALAHMQPDWTDPGDFRAVTVASVLTTRECDRIVAAFRAIEATGQATMRDGDAARVLLLHLGGVTGWAGRQDWPDLLFPPGLDGIAPTLNETMRMWAGALWGLDLFPGFMLLPMFRVDADGPSLGSEWRVDYRADPGSGAFCCKATGIVQLSDPASYDGGDIETFTGRRTIDGGRERGSLTLFPSIALHRRRPITRGERFLMMIAACGPPFR